MNISKLRKKYLDFFESKDHSMIPSASLIPENDPTVLFTTAGMHPLVPFLLGEKHSAGNRLVDVQKCIRTGDIDEVGDAWHLTFFEMLGNWSLGDYWKKEAIEWSFEFLTKELGISKEKLAVSVFEGDKEASFDEESYNLWKEVGVPEERIYKYNKKENWWGPAGQTGPCGPDTEMFFITDKDDCSVKCEPSCSCGKYVEIWNDVFMEYFKNEKGEYEKAKQKNVDTGMGLERTVAVLEGLTDAYQVDTMLPIIKKIEELSDKKYLENEELTKSMRIIADHLRSAVMIVGDNMGVVPSNVDQGYVVRKLIRRAVRHGRILGIEQNFCDYISETVINIFKDVYPEIDKNKNFVLSEIKKEEVKFRKTLNAGLKVFDKKHPPLLKDRKEDGLFPKNTDEEKRIGTISGKEAFDLFATYGFPVELTKEEALKRNLIFGRLEEEEFEEEFKKHQELSRVGADKKFKGGLADSSEETKKLHTATHLLQAALRKVLGDHVYQKGSNITAERLRFDFSHSEKMTDEQKHDVEELINSAIQKDYPVTCQELTVEEAKEKGAIGLFEEKYGEKIKVYTVGDPNQKPTADASCPTFSMEICGGPHVEKTGVLGKFRIKKEEASSSGIRRIKAVLE